ncbi:hypothetical protein N7517_009048 [Penicillium concentricum]|uniref:Uncharacterized protein n=1 Tax=Penicillium concentricum TaxID=293559 RepID=A0A9W9RGG9_9EURO|nr:uncharacterized protein N7517_009048 [Penicillium concentricum]KAJ5359857.1 hypothetical protein N7517_009048 [Penicillium concentricum]
MSEDFESLPPAVRRKFFSNVERLRIRLAQSDHSSPTYSTSNYQDNRVYRTPRLGSDYQRLRNSTRKRGLKRSPSKKLRKPGSLQLAYLAAQADSQCFHSLPAKIQQKLFSPEERRRLRNAYRQSLIYDAADEAYRRDSNRDPRQDSEICRPSTDSHLPQPTVPVQPSTVFYSDSESDDDPNMDQTFHDSFRWLDDDGDLDLSLDEYHAHVADAATRKRSRHSFRRSLSFSNQLRKTLEITPISPRGLPPVSRSQPLTPLSNPSESRPSSRRFQHVPKSSTSSIDPYAQYYQDPDARLKLRVYLASPQKFDEAIEFGFPSLDQNKENIALEVISPKPVSPKPTSSPKPTLVNWDFGTFFEDDDGTMVGSPGGSVENEPIHSPVLTQRDVPRPSVESSTFLQRQSWLPGTKGVPQRLPGNREMTLKMTLTRPDLRTDSPTAPASKEKEDPLRLAALPPADRNQSIWDSDLDEQGMVRKMWRKLRRRV